MSGTCQAIQDIRSGGETDRAGWDFGNNWSPGVLKAQNKSDNAVINALTNNFESINKTIKFYEST